MRLPRGGHWSVSIGVIGGPFPRDPVGVVRRRVGASFTRVGRGKTREGTAFTRVGRRKTRVGGTKTRGAAGRMAARPVKSSALLRRRLKLLNKSSVAATQRGRVAAGPGPLAEGTFTQQ